MNKSAVLRLERWSRFNVLISARRAWTAGQFPRFYDGLKKRKPLIRCLCCPGLYPLWVCFWHGRSALVSTQTARWFDIHSSLGKAVNEQESRTRLSPICGLTQSFRGCYHMCVPGVLHPTSGPKWDWKIFISLCVLYVCSWGALKQDGHPVGCVF